MAVSPDNSLEKVKVLLAKINDSEHENTAVSEAIRQEKEFNKQTNELIAALEEDEVKEKGAGDEDDDYHADTEDEEEEEEEDMDFTMHEAEKQMKTLSVEESEAEKFLRESLVD